MALHGRDFTSRLRIPDARGIISGGCDDPIPVRAEGGGQDYTLMSLEYCDLASCRRVPNARGVVLGARNDGVPSGLKLAVVMSPSP
jgi:hypothetical protein